MEIIVVDTDKRCLYELVQKLKIVYPQSAINIFSDPMSAVKFGFNHKIDMVFTEIPMRGVDGFTLVKLIRKHNVQMAVYFVTANEDYVDEANRIGAKGYLLKPITTEKIKKQIGEL